MLPFKLVYHDKYDLQLGEHVFPFAEISARPRRRFSPSTSQARKTSCVLAPADDADVLRVHHPPSMSTS